MYEFHIFHVDSFKVLTMKIIRLFPFLLFTFYSSAQPYKFAVGVKGDMSTTNSDLAQFSFKNFYSESGAFEINLGTGRRYLWLEGMMMKHIPLRNNLDWYCGAGADLGYWNTNYDRKYNSSERSGFWSGINGVVGIEYTIDFFPLNFALDTGPTLRFLPETELGWKVGIACRYAFKGRL